MVRVGDMLKRKKSLWIQTNDDEARAMFRLHATAIPEQGENRSLFLLQYHAHDIM